MVFQFKSSLNVFKGAVIIYQEKVATFTSFISIFYLKIAETPKMIGKVETGTINRERRKTMVAVLAVEVTTNITHKSSTNKPIKNEKKEWPTPAEASKEERRKE